MINFYDKSFLIIGAGGIGSHVSLKFAEYGVKQIALFDFDDVEYHNLSRTFFKLEDIGLNKANALRSMCETMQSKKQLPKSFFNVLRKGKEDVHSLNLWERESLRKISEFSNLRIFGKTRHIEDIDMVEFKDKGYIIIDCTDGYFSPSEYQGLHLIDWKLNYNNTFLTVTSNPYAKDENGNFRMDIEGLSRVRGYTVTPSFLVTPELVAEMMIQAMQVTGEITMEGTRQWHVELNQLVEQVFTQEAV